MFPHSNCPYARHVHQVELDLIFMAPVSQVGKDLLRKLALKLQAFMVAKIPTIYMQLLQPCAGPFFDQQVFMNILLSRFKVSSVRIVMLIVIN